ncbi:MAG: hypothetical protein ACR2MO_03185 [Acidimicrobiales bacterium]
MTNPTQPMPEDLEEHLDDLVAGGAEPPEAAGGEPISTDPNEAEAEHEPMAVADADHKQDPGQQAGG